MKKYKKMIVFPILLAVTVLLLEIPEHIFQNKDEILSKESGGSVYEIQTVKSIDTFAEKVNAFIDFNKLSIIGNTRKLDYEEMKESLTSLQEEMDVMTNGLYKTIGMQIDDEEMEMMGVEVQIIHRSDNSKEQFVWEVGYLELLNTVSGGGLIFFYDPDSFKIFQLEWFFSGESDGYFGQPLDKTQILDYYREADLKEVTIFEEDGSDLISVLSEEQVYDNDLIIEIRDSLNDYWGVMGIES